MLPWTRGVIVDKDLIWDWEVAERVEDAEEERERLDLRREEGVEASGQGSRREDRNVSGNFHGLPQAENIWIVEDQEETLLEGQLEDIREQEEDNMSLPVHLNKTPLVEEDVVTNAAAIAQLEAEGEQENYPGGGSQDPPQLTMDVEKEGHNLQDLQLQENQDFPLQQQDDIHLSPLQNHDDMLVGDNPQVRTPSPLASIPSVLQDTVQTKLAMLSFGEGSCSFSDLCPPSTTVRREAAVSFFQLLHMEKEKKIVTCSRTCLV